MYTSGRFAEAKLFCVCTTWQDYYNGAYCQSWDTNALHGRDRFAEFLCPTCNSPPVVVILCSPTVSIFPCRTDFGTKHIVLHGESVTRVPRRDDRLPNEKFPRSELYNQSRTSRHSSARPYPASDPHLAAIGRDSVIPKVISKPSTVLKMVKFHVK